MVHWNHVSLIFSGARLVKVLVSYCPVFDTHMELRLFSGHLEVRLHIVSVSCRGKELAGQSFSRPLAEHCSNRGVSRVLRIVFLGANRFIIGPVFVTLLIISLLVGTILKPGRGWKCLGT